MKSLSWIIGFGDTQSSYPRYSSILVRDAHVKDTCQGCVASVVDSLGFQMTEQNFLGGSEPEALVVALRPSPPEVRKHCKC